MLIAFEHPEALAGLAALAVFLWMHRGSLADHSRLQKRISCALRCVVAGLIVAALAGLQLDVPSKRVALAVLVDVSDSVSAEAAAEGMAFARELERGRGANKVAVFAFARSAAPVEDLSGERTPLAKELLDGTDVQGAIELALATFPAGYLGRIVLCSDGLDNRGDVREAARQARARNVPVLARPYEAPDLEEVILTNVSLPPDVQPAASAAVTVEVFSSIATDATIAVYRNQWKVAENAVAIAEGENRFVFDVHAPEAGFMDTSAAITARSDTWTDNNTGRAIASVRAQPRVLLIEDKEADARFLYRALSKKKIKVDLRPGEAFPTTLAELENYSLVILGDVPYRSLPEGALDILGVYVRDLGGGLLTLGGENAYGLGGYKDTPLAAMLPVEMESESRRDIPTLALAMVVDKSGSMANAKIELAKAAASAAVEILSDEDYAGLIAFDAMAHRICPITSAADRAGIVSQIQRLSAGGGTNMYPALMQAREDLLSARAALRHIILLTDGRTTGSGYEELASRISGDLITISTVAVGQGADTALLQRMAALGRGRYYFTDDPRTIPRIFVKETMAAQRSAVIEDPFVPQVMSPAELLRGIPLDEAPPLYGYVLLKPKPLAEVLLTSERGDPLLARCPHGLGSVASFASDATNRWAADWIEWPAYTTFFVQLARDTMRRDSGGLRFTASASIAADDGKIVADLSEASGPFINNAAVSAVVVGPDLSDSQIALVQRAPGRYEGAFDASERGAYLVRVRAQRDMRSLGGTGCAASRGYPAEYARFGVDRAMLTDLAEGTGGGLIETAADAFTAGGGLPGRTTRRQIDLTAPALIAAAAVFLLDVLVRRLHFGRDG